MNSSHRLELSVAAAPLVVDRVVSVCRARRCPIVALDFQAGDRHRSGSIALTVDANGARARLLEDRLAALADVLAVGR
jgi:acetolactate synthase regulatory subunit